MLNIGDPAPPFTGKDVLTGQTFSLEDYRGQTIVIAFNGITWCPPCRLEAPVLQDLWDEFRAGSGSCSHRVQFVMIFRDHWETSTVDQLPNALETFGITMPVLNDPAIVSAYDVDPVPVVYVVNPDFKICKVKLGAQGPEDTLREEIREMIQACTGDCVFRPIPGIWMAVATILVGVTQGGGGLIFVGDKPVEIDPWDPLRRMTRDKRDALLGLAVSELARHVADPKARRDLETRALRLVDASTKRVQERNKRMPVELEDGRVHYSEFPRGKK